MLLTRAGWFRVISSLVSVQLAKQGGKPKIIREAVPRRYIHGIIHCSGGGQTKIRKFGRSGNRYVKYRPFPVPAVFKMIQEVSKLSWREMYEVFNMGWRIEMGVPDMKVANDIRKIAID